MTGLEKTCLIQWETTCFALSVCVASGHQASDLAIPTSSCSYRARGLIKEISSSKMAHLKQIYNNFIAPDRHLDILPPRDPQ